MHACLLCQDDKRYPQTMYNHHSMVVLSSPPTQQLSLTLSDSQHTKSQQFMRKIPLHQCHSHITHLQQWPSQPRISLYLGDCLTHWSHYLTADNDMPHVDDRLPFCCKLTVATNCSAKIRKILPQQYPLPQHQSVVTLRKTHHGSINFETTCHFVIYIRINFLVLYSCGPDTEPPFNQPTKLYLTVFKFLAILDTGTEYCRPVSEKLHMQKWT